MIRFIVVLLTRDRGIGVSFFRGADVNNIRQEEHDTAENRSVPLSTNLQIAELFLQALAAKKPEDLEVKTWVE